MSWVQKQLEHVEEAVLPDVSSATVALPVSEGCEEVSAKCKLFCCVSHCQVRFHSMSKKPMLDIPIVNMVLGLGDDVVFRGLPGPDLEATIANMIYEESVTVGQELCEERNFVVLGPSQHFFPGLGM